MMAQWRTAEASRPTHQRNPTKGQKEGSTHSVISYTPHTYGVQLDWTDVSSQYIS